MSIRSLPSFLAALLLTIVGATAIAAPPDKHPMIGARDRAALVPEDLAAFYVEVGRSLDAHLFPDRDGSTRRAATLVKSLATLVGQHRNWTAFTAAELDRMSLEHNEMIDLLALDAEDKISCVRARVAGSRITAAVCSAWSQ